jgi:hypothetical protein
LFLRPLAHLCGTRALLQRLTAMAIRRSKRRTSALRSAREREREAKKRQRAGTRGRRWRAPFCVHMGWAKPTLWPSPLVFTWTWPRTYLVAKPSCVHIEVAKPSLLVIHMEWARPTLCYLQREQLLAPNLPMKEGNLFCRYEIH